MTSNAIHLWVLDENSRRSRSELQQHWNKRNQLIKIVRCNGFGATTIKRRKSAAEPFIDQVIVIITGESGGPVLERAGQNGPSMVRINH